MLLGLQLFLNVDAMRLYEQDRVDDVAVSSEQTQSSEDDQSCKAAQTALLDKKTVSGLALPHIWSKFMFMFFLIFLYIFFYNAELVYWWS